jgi:hypothetical protein
MSIKWTPKKIASLDAVKKILNLPFEVGILFGLYENGYTIFLCKPGSFKRTEFPLRNIVKLLPERNRVQLAYVHNHPGILGNGCLPSGGDYFAFKQRKFLCDLLGIKLFDAISVDNTGKYYSFKENNLL